MHIEPPAMSVIPLAFMMFVLLIGVALVVVGAILSTRNSQSKVHWGPILAVLVGLPVLLAGAVVTLYFLRGEASTSQATVYSEGIYPEASVSETRAAGDRSISLVTLAPTPESPVLSQQLPVAPPSPIIQVQSPAQFGMNWMVLLGAVGSLFAVLLLLKKPKVAFSLMGILLLAGLFLKTSVVKISNPTVVHETHTSTGKIEYELPQLQIRRSLAELSTSELAQPSRLSDVALGPVDENGKRPDAPQHIEVRAFDAKGHVSKKVLTGDALPKWVVEANGKTVRDGEELIVTSSLYSTPQEAEAELQAATNLLLRQIAAEQFAFPVSHSEDMTLAYIDLLEQEILQESCIMKWPFQIGEVEDEIYQVAWKLELGERQQQVFHERWRDHELRDRLFWLGGGLAGLTTLFGAGAVITRRREDHLRSDQQAA